MKDTCVFFLLAATAFAQTPAFDAASIHPNRLDSPNSSIQLTPGRVAMTGVTLKKVILNAWGIPDDREYALVGPNWIGVDRYDIEATFPTNTQPQAVRQMLQMLILDRFKMAIHTESRKLPGYALVVAKSGLRIKPAEPGQGRTSTGPGRFVAEKTSMQKFADLLAKQAGRPVSDATGALGGLRLYARLVAVCVSQR